MDNSRIQHILKSNLWIRSICCLIFLLLLFLVVFCVFFLFFQLLNTFSGFLCRTNNQNHKMSKCFETFIRSIIQCPYLQEKWRKTRNKLLHVGEKETLDKLIIIAVDLPKLQKPSELEWPSFICMCCKY